MKPLNLLEQLQSDRANFFFCERTTGHAQREQVISTLINIVSGQVVLARGSDEDISLERCRISLSLHPFKVLLYGGRSKASYITCHDTGDLKESRIFACIFSISPALSILVFEPVDVRLRLADMGRQA